jgi:hypothetical protein
MIERKMDRSHLPPEVSSRTEASGSIRPVSCFNHACLNEWIWFTRRNDGLSGQSVRTHEFDVDQQALTPIACPQHAHDADRLRGKAQMPAVPRACAMPFGPGREGSLRNSHMTFVTGRLVPDLNDGAHATDGRVPLTANAYCSIEVDGELSGMSSVLSSSMAQLVTPIGPSCIP